MTQQAFSDSIYTIISVCLLFASIFSVLFVYQRTPSLYMLAYPRVSARRVACLDGVGVLSLSLRALPAFGGFSLHSAL